ncbi:hypothetical protein ACQEVF_17850 [Nonomuraea polychroma]
MEIHIAQEAAQRGWRTPRCDELLGEYAAAATHPAAMSQILIKLGDP